MVGLAYKVYLVLVHAVRFAQSAGYVQSSAAAVVWVSSARTVSTTVWRVQLTDGAATATKRIGPSATAAKAVQRCDR